MNTLMGEFLGGYVSRLKLNKACAVIHSCNTLGQLHIAERDYGWRRL